MTPQKLQKLLEEIFPNTTVHKSQETYYNTPHPTLLIKWGNFSLLFKNQRIGILTQEDKWEIEFPQEADFMSKTYLPIPTQNVKEFLLLCKDKLQQYESLQLELKIFYSSLNDLKTNPQKEIRNYKLNSLTL